MMKKMLFAAVSSVFISHGFAADPEVINGVLFFKEPPSAYELAKSLYPPQTRAIVVENKKINPPQPKTGGVGFMVNFEYDSVHITESSRPYLDSLGDMLNFKQLKDKPLVIEGHADATGDAYYNLQLSEARARAIKDYLVSVHRIDADRLFTAGHGENKLLDPNHPAAEINRRAEFKPK